MKLLVLILFAVLSLNPVLAQSRVKMLEVGWDENPPMQMSSGERLRGIDVEIATEVIQGAGYRPKFVKLPWARQLKLIESGRLDVAMGASITEDRKPFAVWTAAYRIESTSLFKLESTPSSPSSLAELLGGRSLIGVMRGSEFPGEFERLQRDTRFQELLVTTTSNQNSLDMLRLRRFPYVIEDKVVFSYLAQSQRGEPVVEALQLAAGEVHFMLGNATLKKYPGVLEALNASLKRLKASKGIERIFAHYGLKP